MNLNQQQHLKSILAALAYFDVFAFPLTKLEILKYSHFSSLSELEKPLLELLQHGIIYQDQGYFSIRKDPELAIKREENTIRAEQYLDQAKKKSKLIGQFPYVKGVFISGSLSKGVMDEDGDIDFFIVTQPERLWIARTLLILYKKIFLLNSRKYFCINYLVDENSLEIEQQNRFTAVELLSLYPMINKEAHQQIIQKNGWIQDFFSKNFHENPNVQNLESNRLKSMIERVLNGKLGNQLDDFFMRITLKRWQQKFGNMSENDFNIALKTSKKVSKHHPSNFQKRVLNGFDQRMEELHPKMNDLALVAIYRA